MACVMKEGKWYKVSLNGEDLGWFKHSIDAHRFALAMLHDGIADSVRLLSGLIS